MKQAAQLLANIIDFADTGDVPTIVSNTDMGETGATPFNVYGAKGLHVTQVMPTPDAIYSAKSDGAEMTNNGSGTDKSTWNNNNWEWVTPGNYWARPTRQEEVRPEIQ